MRTKRIDQPIIAALLHHPAIPLRRILVRPHARSRSAVRPARAMASGTRCAHGRLRGQKLLLECRLEYGKRARRHPQRVRHARVMRPPRLVDADPRRRLTWRRRRAERNPIPLRFERTIDEISSHAPERRRARNERRARGRSVRADEAGKTRRPRRSGASGPGPAATAAPPSKIDLVSPEPQWAKFCAKEPTNGREACATMRDFSTSADQPPMISINLFEVAGEEKRKLRVPDPADRHAAEARLPRRHRQERAARWQVRHVLPERLLGRDRDRAEDAGRAEEGAEHGRRHARARRRRFGARDHVQRSAEGSGHGL